MHLRYLRGTQLISLPYCSLILMNSRSSMTAWPCRRRCPSDTNCPPFESIRSGYRYRFVLGPDASAGPVAASESLARLGGDEFTILLEGIRDCGDAIRVAERIQERLAFLLLWKDKRW